MIFDSQIIDAYPEPYRNRLGFGKIAIVWGKFADIFGGDLIVGNYAEQNDEIQQRFNCGAADNLSDIADAAWFRTTQAIGIFQFLLAEEHLAA